MQFRVLFHLQFHVGKEPQNDPERAYDFYNFLLFQATFSNISKDFVKKNFETFHQHLNMSSKLFEKVNACYHYKYDSTSPQNVTNLKQSSLLFFKQFV